MKNIEKLKKKLYEDAIKSLGKADSSLTEDERFAKIEVSIDEYTKEKLESSLLEIESNISGNENDKSASNVLKKLVDNKL